MNSLSFKNALKWVLSVMLLQICLPATAQNDSIQRANFSRWSIGVNFGSPVFWGDFTSFTPKYYPGFSSEIQASYQLNPILGTSLSLEFGQAKLGHQEYAKDYHLFADGNAHIGKGEFSKYENIKSLIKYTSIGFHVDINFSKLFGIHQFYGVLISPSVYLQHFSPKVNKLNGDQFTDGSLKNDWSIGLGANASFRHLLTKNFDLLVKTGLIWVTDNNFDGIATANKRKQNLMWNTSLGIVFKTKKNRSKHDLLYYPNKFAPKIWENKPNNQNVKKENK